MTIQFRHLMLMVPDVMASVKFYSEGLGLPIVTASPGWGEISADGTTIAFHSASEPAKTGNSPILSFHVDDIQGTIAHLESLGGTLEGRIREPSFGKVAAIRSPDGHLISLLQPTPSEAH